MDDGRERTKCDRFRCPFWHLLRRSRWLTSGIGRSYPRTFAISSSEAWSVDRNDVFLLRVVCLDGTCDCGSYDHRVRAKLRHSPVLERRMSTTQCSLHGHVDTSQASFNASAGRAIRGEKKATQFQIDSQELQLPDPARGPLRLIRFGAQPARKCRCTTSSLEHTSPNSNSSAS